MFNEIMLLGHLGRDPEMRYTPQGRAVTDFSIAVNRRYTNGAGEQVKETLWFKVSTWGKLAETTHQYLTKGRLVLVKGRLQGDPATGGPRLYTRADGTPGASFEVTPTTVLFLSRREEAGEDSETEISAEEAEIPF